VGGLVFVGGGGVGVGVVVWTVVRRGVFGVSILVGGLWVGLGWGWGGLGEREAYGWGDFLGGGGGGVVRKKVACVGSLGVCACVCYLEGWGGVF